MAKLQDLCAYQICRDFVRHAKGWQLVRNNNDVNTIWYRGYITFQKRCMDEVGDFLCSRFIRQQRFLKSDPNMYTACLNFVFNPYIKQLCCYKYNYLDFDEEMVSVIATNCKDLHSILIRKMYVPRIFFSQLLGYLTNLVMLDLSKCSFNPIRTMKVIADSLIHLRELYLSNTRVGDRSILSLCGHEHSDCPLIQTCSPEVPNSEQAQGGTKTCEISNKMKLQNIDLTDTKVTHIGFICLLTHIKTLTCVHATSWLSEEIYAKAVLRIRTYEEELEAQNFSFQSLHIDRIDSYIEDFVELRSFLRVFPRIKSLNLQFTDPQLHRNGISRVLEENELQCLKSISISCRNTDSIFTDSFQSFWTRKGAQLEELSMLPLVGENWVESKLAVLRYILSTCSELQQLELHLSLKDSENLEEFPDLPKLEYLILGLNDENVDFANELATNIISSARNLKYLALEMDVNTEILLPCMSVLILPLLKEVTFNDLNIDKDYVRSALCSDIRHVDVMFY